MFETVAALSGLIAMVWLIIGVYIASRFYPNYDHAKQFCSELGASGSPTEKLSPRINNYPLGLLFCLFGGYMTLYCSEKLEQLLEKNKNNKKTESL